MMMSSSVPIHTDGIQLINTCWKNNVGKYTKSYVLLLLHTKSFHGFPQGLRIGRRIKIYCRQKGGP